MWDGGDVWILGGGPSLTRQFDIPDEVVQRVVSGASLPDVYSPYMSAIHSKHVIGINVAFMIGNWIDMVFFGDPGFFLKYRDKLAAFPKLRVTCVPSAGRASWIKLLPLDRSHRRGISSFPNMVSWNKNSGAAAISIAANAGAKRIILVGFDMKLGQDKRRHWHDIYKRGVVTNDRQMMKLHFSRHLLGFPEIAKDARARGIEILNACPDSAIKDFPKVTVKELL